MFFAEILSCIVMLRLQFPSFIRATLALFINRKKEQKKTKKRQKYLIPTYFTTSIEAQEKHGGSTERAVDNLTIVAL